MRVATWNVNGIRAREAQLLELIDRHAPDVLCLQEIKAPPAKVPAALCELSGYWCFWHGETAYSGVGLHLSKAAFPEAPAFSHPEFDLETRVVTARAGDTVFASVYVPNGGKDFPAKMKFLEQMEAWIAARRAEGLELVVCGDLNVTRTDMDVHPKERKFMVIGQRPDERELIERILAAGVVDVQRALEPTNPELFTWWAPWRNMKQRNIGWRLDYVLASPNLYARVKGCAVLREVGTSDHGPVIADFSP